MKIRINSFGQLTEVIGKNPIVFEAQTIDEVKEQLHNQFPSLQKLKFALAVNNRLADGNVKLEEGDIVSLLPPFSGG